MVLNMAKTIKELLSFALKSEDNWKINLLQNWPDIIGDLKSKVQLEKVQDATLILSVVDACWLQELYLLSPILLRAINEKLDQPRIKRLRFKQAGIKKEIKKRTQKTQKKVIGPITLTTRQESALNNIQDPQLSEALKRFLARCYYEKE